MPLNLTLDRNKKRSLYQQIITQIVDQIRQGELPVGTRLPPLRQLAKTLSVTRLTVHNAYSELQAQGWVESVVGRGTFVAEAGSSHLKLATLEQAISPESVIGDLTPLSQVPGIRFLASAFPDDTLMPMTDFWQSLNQLQAHGGSLLQYSVPQGEPQLRVELAPLLEERGVSVTPDDLIITAGATQGAALVAQALANRGDTVLVEQPTYHGFINTLTSQGVHIIGVPRDQAGIRLDILERLIIQERPRFFYVVPNFHNPTGWLLPLAQRQELLDMAGRYGLLLVEDDVYGRLSYLDSEPPALKALDQREAVIYLSSFSKDLMPGVRIGYLVAPPSLKKRLLALRGAADLFGSQIFQLAVADMLRRKKFKPHLRRVRPIYRQKRDVMLQTLAECMPNYVRWSEPAGGFACWLTLPDDSR
ncbi:MAG: PLP-dependent aminotransferase family protein, partial [Anaerolineae bacterium]|nr:PLP-dependent aminotransferase family protein [Anaerolineae bacterium]